MSAGYLTWKRLYFPANFSVPAVVKHALARFFQEGQPHEGPLDWNLIIEAAINIRFIQSHNPLDDQQNRVARRFRREPFVDLLKGLGANAVDSHSVPHVTPAQALVYYLHWPAWHEDRGALGYMHPFRFAFCRYEDDLKRAGFDFKINDEKLNWALVSKWIDSLGLEVHPVILPQHVPGSRLRGWDHAAANAFVNLPYDAI
ncbi:hypothetical protein PG989_007609 [Apiospora arundinis]